MRDDGWMRAERLLRIIFLLQSRGKLTAKELADDLEVSVRTIQRDMEALSGAGIPVYATRGGDGGWALLKEYRTSISGLTTTDVLSIVVGRTPKLLSELGLDDPGDAPVLKLMDAISPSGKLQAEHARQRVHVDLSSWGAVAHTALPLLQEAVWEDRIIEIRYRNSRSRFPVAPLGLVSKGGSWYLVAMNEDQIRTYNVERVHDIVITDTHFERPTGFDLAEHWAQAEVAFTQTFSRYVVRLRVRGNALAQLGWTYAASKDISEPDEDGWADATLDLREEQYALGTLRALGPEVIVLSPARLRRLAVDQAHAFAALNER